MTSIPRKKVAAAVALPLLALGSLTACGTDNNRDLKGVQNTHPDWIRNVINEDGQPNLAILCYQGVGFVTTTRKSAAALHVLPSLRSFCLHEHAKRVAGGS